MTEEIKAIRQEVDEIKKVSEEAIAKLEAESSKLIQSQKELRESFEALEKEILKNHIHLQKSGVHHFFKEMRFPNPHPRPLKSKRITFTLISPKYVSITIS